VADPGGPGPLGPGRANLAALAAEMRAVLAADAGVAVYLDDGEGALRLAYGDGTIGRRLEARGSGRPGLDLSLDIGRAGPPGATLIVPVPDIGGGFVAFGRSRHHAFSRDDRAVARVYARRLASRIATVEADERDAHWTRELDAILRIGARLTRLASVEEVGQTITAETRQVIDYHNCRVYVLEENGIDLTPVAFRGEIGAYRGETYEALRCKVGEGLTGLVAARGEPLVVPDAANDPRGIQIPGTEVIDESILLMPMVYEGRVSGVIVLSKLGIDQFVTDDVRLLHILSDQAAVAIANSRLLASRDKLVAELRALLDISGSGNRTRDEGALAGLLARRIAAAVGVEACAILRWAEGTTRLQTLGSYGAGMPRVSLDLLDHPVLRRALRERSPIVFQADAAGSDAAELSRMRARGDRTLLVLPLVASGSVIGVAELSMRTRPRTYTAAELDYCVTLANHTAAVLENAWLLDRLRRAADVDPVTGLANHRQLQERLVQEVARASRTGQPLGVVMLDLDGFKLINDRYGHAAGDLVLHELAATMRVSVRTNDIVARYGGDEFVILMPDTPAREARAATHRLLAALRGRSYRLANGHEVSVGASVGLAIYPGDGLSPGALLSAADRAMYAVKRRGGGGARLARGDEHPDHPEDPPVPRDRGRRPDADPVQQGLHPDA